MILSTTLTAPSSSGTVSLGATSIAVYNTGSADITFDGATIPSGTSVNYPPIPGSEYPEITYDPGSSTMLLLVIRSAPLS